MKNKVHEYLKKSDILAEVKEIQAEHINTKRKIDFAFEGTLDIVNNKVPLQIAFDKFFPLCKPLFFLKKWDALGFIPHIEDDGFICYIHDEGLVLNQDDPVGVLDFCLTKAIKTLVDGVTGKNIEDFYNEFEAYWVRLEQSILAVSFIEITSYYKEISVVYNPKMGKLILGDSYREILNLAKRICGEDNSPKSIGKAIYIPLRTHILPPAFNKFWTPQDLRRTILDNISSSTRRMLKAYLNYKKVKRDSLEFIILSIPLPNGNTAIIGIQLSHFHNLPNDKSKSNIYPHPLNKIKALFNMKPITIQRFDKGYILPRAGSNHTLSDKKVLLIGCGSVGSHIALELVRAGVMNLTLVDKDLLHIENVYRHALGVSSLFEAVKNKDKEEYYSLPKVIGLKREIESKFPYVLVMCHQDDIEELILDKMIEPSEYDLIVVALGNPTIELYLNSYFHSLLKCPPVIFTWLEAFGIGGHALLTKINNKVGCLNCLYLDSNGLNTDLFNRASFAEAGQFFGKIIAGCGSVFTPYGSMDAISTAILATRLATDTLLGREMDCPLLSWKGDSRIFLEQGYTLSERYKLSNGKLYNLRYAYKEDKCTVCGNQR
ncbi:E2/UBC family protein [Desulforamulus ruminis]|uniref:E2/UBC family protein n=1 Tax=Desulforamulus ruminis TaxID=1564 RepID=UPI002353C76A|nr:E2/UBC family protein [Desulforamulus ruminis]